MFHQFYNSRLGHKLISLTHRSLDLVFPKKCLCCREFSDHDLCNSCTAKIFSVNNLKYCYGCSRVIDEGVCVQCSTKDLPRVYALLAYDRYSKKLVTDFKFNDQTYMAKTYAAWLACTYKEIIQSADVIVPVPMHKKRLFVRKYNQAGLLAKAIAKLIDIEVDHFSLVKIKDTLQQASLPAAKRVGNIRNAFALSNKAVALKNKRIILLEDIISTGATIRECYDTLLKAEVKEIIIISLMCTMYF